MKLVVILSVIACGYAAKLDRTYLPPSSAATAGGNPADLSAPGSTSSFRQGFPNASGSSTGLRPTSGQDNGINGPSVSDIQGFNSIIGAPEQSGVENANAGPSGQGFNNFGSNTQASRVPFEPTPQFNGQAFSEGSKPERAQAAADRSAEILKYINENNGDSYEYSYETSNGIAAEESGVATDGIRAQGGYSYTGDDGKFYSITYTADENGFQPEGEHLPTPHPIPEEILKSIEENARAAAAGTQEGAYRPEEYESDSSPQQYNTGSTSNYKQPQQSISSPQGQGSPSQEQIPQDAFNANSYSQRQPEQVSSLSGTRPQQQPNQFSQGPATSTQYTQPQSSQGSNVFRNQQGKNQNTQGQNGQGLAGNGYNYNRPQGNQPQQGQPQKGFGNMNQGLPRQPSTTPFGNQGPSERVSQGQRGQDQSGNGYSYNQPQKPAQGLSGQGNQQKRPQTFFPSVGGSNNGLSSQQPSQTTSQSNQQQKQPVRGFNQFNNQQGANIQDQGESGYNYNQPQNFAQGSKQFPGLGGQQNTNSGISGQKIQPTSQISQPQRSNLFGKQERPLSQNSQRERAQNQRDNGYNYDRPQNQQGSSQFSGQRQSPSKGAFGQETGSSNQLNQPQQPFKGSNNLFGKEREPTNQFSQGQGQNQRENGYNYNQPQKPTGSSQAFESQSGQPQRVSQAMGINEKLFPGTLSAQPKGQFNQPQNQPSGQRNQYTPSQKGQDQDENGYYYNQPQGGSPTSQGSFGQRPQPAQSQSTFPQRPSPSYEANSNAQASRPSQQGSSFQPRPSSSNFGPANPSQGSQSPEANEQTFGSSITSPVSGVVRPIGSSQPKERYQPNLAPASKFQPQLGSQNTPSQTLAQGYQYKQPENSQSQRPGFNPTGDQGASGSAGSEFGGPRQPPSFSAEEGYRYKDQRIRK